MSHIHYMLLLSLLYTYKESDRHNQFRQKFKLWSTINSMRYVTEVHDCLLTSFVTKIHSELWLDGLQFWMAWISPFCSFRIKQSFSSHLTLSCQIKVAIIHLRSIFSAFYSAVHLLWESFPWICPSMEQHN